MKKELFTNLHSFNDLQKEKIIKIACDSYWSTTELNSSAASKNLYKFLKNEDNLLGDKWHKIKFYLSQSQNDNRKFFKMLLDAIEEEISKTNTDIRFETGRIDGSIGTIVATDTLETLRFGWEYGFLLSCTIIGIPVLPLAVGISAVVGLLGGIVHAISYRPTSAEEQNDLFQRLMSIKDEKTKKRVVSAIKLEFKSEESVFADMDTPFVNSLDEKNANSFELIKAYAIAQEGMLTSNNGATLFNVIKNVITKHTDERRQVLPETNLQEQSEPECDGLNITQKAAVIQEIGIAYGNGRLGSSQESKNVINTLKNEKMSTDEKWDEIEKFTSDSTNAHRRLHQIINNEIDLEISKTDIGHRVNKKLIADKGSYYSFFVGKSITNNLDKVSGIATKTCRNVRGGSLLAVPLAPTALIIGGLSGVGHGIFKACTRNPISVAQYQDLFTKLNSIHDAGVKTRIIDTVLKKYNTSWHLSQSHSSFKLINKLSAKRLNCHEKFDYLKEYMTSQSDKYIYNNGKKLFNIIQETVLQETMERLQGQGLSDFHNAVGINI